MSIEMDDNSIMPFGKFKGDKLIDVPAWYMLELIKGNKCYGALKNYLEDNEEIFIQEKEEEDRRKKL